MPRQRSPARQQAHDIWSESGGKIMLKDIAAQVGVSEGLVRKWKNQDQWEKVTLPKNNSNVTKRKKGAQKGNKNAVGHGAPRGNKNAEKHGFFTRYLPPETLEIMQEIDDKSPLDILWDQIMLQYSAILRAQQIMYVRDQEDKTIEKVEKKDGKVIGERWEVQQAWDKQATFLSAQSRAMTALNGLIKQYEEMSRSDLATEEQRARIDKLKAEVEHKTPADLTIRVELPKEAEDYAL